MCRELGITEEQIFGLYANIIEWGPNIYGLREASYYYFGKTPARLSAKQMTYLASVIPGPLLFHKYYEQGRVPPKHMAKLPKRLLSNPCMRPTSRTTPLLL